MIFNSVAYYCQSKEAEDNVKKVLNLTNASWEKDLVTCISEVSGRRPFRNQFESQVNGDLGIDIELIRYTEGNFWIEPDLLSVPNDVPIISHMGIFLDDKGFPMLPKHWRMVQESFSNEHTNHKIVEKNWKFHYRTYTTMSRTYIQFVKRMHRPGGSFNGLG